MSLFDGILHMLKAKRTDDIENESAVVDINDRGGSYTEETASEFIAYVKQELERRRNDRRAFELQWLLNSNFLAGHQYCDINPSSGEIEDCEPEYDYLERGVYYAAFSRQRAATVGKYAQSFC